MDQDSGMTNEISLFHTKFSNFGLKYAVTFNRIKNR